MLKTVKKYEKGSIVLVLSFLILSSIFLAATFSAIPIIIQNTNIDREVEIDKSQSSGTTINIDTLYEANNNWFNVRLLNFGGLSVKGDQEVTINGVSTRWWTSGAYIVKNGTIDYAENNNNDGTYTFHRMYTIHFSIMGFTTVTKSFFNAQEDWTTAFLTKKRDAHYEGEPNATFSDYELGANVSFLNYELFGNESFHTGADKHAKGSLAVNININNQYSLTPQFNKTSGTFEYIDGTALVALRSITSDWDSNDPDAWGIVDAPGVTVNLNRGDGSTNSEKFGYTPDSNGVTDNTTTPDIEDVSEDIPSTMPTVEDTDTGDTLTAAIGYDTDFGEDGIATEIEGADVFNPTEGRFDTYTDIQGNVLATSSQQLNPTTEKNYYIFPYYDLSPESIAYLVQHEVGFIQYTEKTGYINEPDYVAFAWQTALLGIATGPVGIAIAVLTGVPTTKVQQSGIYSSETSVQAHPCTIGYQVRNVWIKQDFEAKVEVYATYNYTPRQDDYNELNPPQQGGNNDTFNDLDRGTKKIIIYLPSQEPEPLPLWFWILLIVIIAIVVVVALYFVSKGLAGAQEQGEEAFKGSSYGKM